MPYRKRYMSSHDIDWYACVNHKWIYASSMGGLLPNKINNDTFLPLLQTISYNLPDLVEEDKIIVNNDLIVRRYERAVRVYREYYIQNDDLLNRFLENFTLDSFGRAYTAEFISMARKGFISYIRENIDDPLDNNYIIVAEPSEEISVKLSDFFDSPLPEWLNSKQFKAYLNMISKRFSIGNSHQAIDLWDLFQ